MDANGLRCWSLMSAPRAGQPEADWRFLGNQPGLEFDLECRRVRLRSERRAAAPVERADAAAEAARRLELLGRARDAHGTYARWKPASEAATATSPAVPEPGAIVAGGSTEGEVILLTLPEGDNDVPTDFAVGFDGMLYVARGGAVEILNLRERDEPRVTVELPGLAPWRLAPNPAGGVWVLDRDNRRLARLRGRGRLDRGVRSFAPDVARPDPENPDPPRLIPIERAVWPAGEAPIAIACHLASGVVLVLSRRADGTAALRELGQDSALQPPVSLLRRRTIEPEPPDPARFAYALAWASPDRVAVLDVTLARTLADPVPDGTAATVAEALVYEWPVAGASALPVGDLYAMPAYDGGPFAHGVTQPLHYLRAGRLAPLHPVSFPSYAITGEAQNARTIDAGEPDAAWHRIYIEGSFPARCGAQVFLAAGPEPDATIPPDQWYEHRVGTVPGADVPGVPRAAWLSLASEIPFHPGFGCDSEPDRSGLFTVLAQRAGRRVRTLRGRYLHVRIRLHGDGRDTPEIAALRIHGPRFSYVQRYYPELYQEMLFGPDADAAEPHTTRADFHERFVCNIEGVLTPIEDRIGSAYLLTDPRTAPAAALPWLGSWLAVDFDSALDEPRRRRSIAEAATLYRERGTIAGLRRALDIATGGACERGEVVVVEDFKLRRTFATILGADYADEDDPLLAGVVQSGNSFVGETLILGDEGRREFLALFRADQLLDSEEREVRAFFEQLAWRVTVLVHDDVSPVDQGLVRRVVERETPAHVISRVVSARHPFLVAVSSLVGVDTFLTEKPRPEPIRLDVSGLGVRDIITRPAALDPRLEGGAA